MENKVGGQMKNLNLPKWKRYGKKIDPKLLKVKSSGKL